ncbi:MAG: hypothetical protein FWD87_02265 [Spirochaetaceae bacterium]|nr:hypothetical protein [Spirochaetaceae bacterium]
MGHKGFAALTVLFLVLAWFSWKEEKLQDERLANSVSTTPAASTRLTIPVTAAASAATRTSDSQRANIEATLRIVARKWKITDVNGDGLFNCIDAAVLFYKYFPDRSSVAIIINVNPRTGMNHLFNAVLIDGVWRTVEPQTYAINHRSYWMRDVWGNKYNSNFNRDETARWSIYAR